MKKISESVLVFIISGMCVILCVVGMVVYIGSDRDIFQSLSGNEIELYQNLFEEPVANVEQYLSSFQEISACEEINVEYQGGNFPPELIDNLGKLLYEICKPNNIYADYEVYTHGLKQLCANEYEMSLEDMMDLFPELEMQQYNFADIYEAYAYVSGSENCLGIFHFVSSIGKDYFLFCIDSGGSYGANNLWLTEYNDGNFSIVSDFDTQNNGYGTVIDFQGNYYYVLMQYNYNLKNYDSIRVNQLGSDVDSNYVYISYKPQNYQWKEILTTELSSSMTTYLDGIKKN